MSGPSVSDLNSAARAYADDYADYDEEYDYYQRLVSDETFGLLAYICEQLRIIEDHRGQMSDTVGLEVVSAQVNMSTAMDDRAEQLKEDG